MSEYFNPKSKRRKADRFTEKKYLPYVTAIGQLALAWNDLHERLALAFMQSLDGRADQAMNIWFSAKFDRPRRDMLKAALECVGDFPAPKFPNFRTDLLWVLKEANSLEDARNDAVHSPLWPGTSNSLFVASSGYQGVGPLAPYTLLGNPRAKKLLARQDLLAEFRWCRDTALTLRDFVSEILKAVMIEDWPWPKRPKLPNRGQKSRRKHDRRAHHQ